MSVQKPAHKCVQQLYSSLPKLGSNHDVLWWVMDEQTWSIRQWTITQD